MATKYKAKALDEGGFIAWSDEENQVWHDLIIRQKKLIKNRACDEYIKGLEILNFSEHRVPQLEEVSSILRSHTGWEIAPVSALIPFSEFFELLAEKKFPCATFIRSREEFDYLQEPDIFHEIFGHTPLLTNQYFADFTHTYGQLGLEASREDRIFLARMYWFTVEFGLIQRPEGMRIYGGGILSSPGETLYALDHKEAIRRPFELLDVLRTPYRIDIMQPIYFTINEMSDLFDITQLNIQSIVEKAKQLGLHKPLFLPKDGKAKSVKSPMAGSVVGTLAE